MKRWKLDAPKTREEAIPQTVSYSRVVLTGIRVERALGGIVVSRALCDPATGRTSSEKETWISYLDMPAPLKDVLDALAEKILVRLAAIGELAGAGTMEEDAQ